MTHLPAAPPSAPRTRRHTFAVMFTAAMLSIGLFGCGDGQRPDQTVGALTSRAKSHAAGGPAAGRPSDPPAGASTLRDGALELQDLAGSWSVLVPLTVDDSLTLAIDNNKPGCETRVWEHQATARAHEAFSLDLDPSGHDAADVIEAPTMLRTRAAARNPGLLLLTSHKYVACLQQDVASILRNSTIPPGTPSMSHGPLPLQLPPHAAGMRFTNHEMTPCGCTTKYDVIDIPIGRALLLLDIHWENQRVFTKQEEKAAILNAAARLAAAEGIPGYRRAKS